MPLLTSQQLARELGISQRTLRRYVAIGRIPIYKLPSGTLRFDLAKVLRALEVKRR